MKEIINKILGSLDTKDSDSFSARKLSAFVVIILVIVLHVKWFNSDKWEYTGEVLGLDFMFILSCLGLTTWQNIQTKKIENAKAE